MITSFQNPTIQWVRSLLSKKDARHQEKLFVCEGVRLAEEAISSGQEIRMAFFSSTISERGRELLEKSSFEKIELSPALMDRISATKTSQGLLLVVPFPQFPIPAEPDLLMVLDEIQDPGNFGTILRAAAAFGLQGLLYTTDSVDPYSPKVVRAGMGAHFRIPLLRVNPPDIPALTAGTELYLADVARGIPCWQADLSKPVTFIIGNEAHGASAPMRNYSQQNILIPMPGGMESLNAAMSANILLYETARQRNS
jgi:TrmH family RNA methyltransferase